MFTWRKGVFVINFTLYPFPSTSYIILCFLLSHLILLSAIVCLLSPQLCFLPNFYCFCLLILFPLPLLLPLCFLLQHPPSSKFICSAEFHHVQTQLWHKACSDLVTSNLTLNHNESLLQKIFHHMRGISCIEAVFLDEKSIFLGQLPPTYPRHPTLCRAKNCIYFSKRECPTGPSGEGRSSASYQ